SPPPASGTVATRAGRPIRMEGIIVRTCQALRIPQEELSSKGRHPRVVLARSVISFLARKLTTLSFPEIARGMGRPNHSTIITAYQRIVKQIEAGEELNLLALGIPLENGESGGVVRGVLTIGELCDRLETDVMRAG